MIYGGGRETPTTSGTAATATPVRSTSRSIGPWKPQPTLDRIIHDPDPESRSGAVAIIGYSRPSAGFVITIVATGSAHAGVTA